MRLNIFKLQFDKRKRITLIPEFFFSQFNVKLRLYLDGLVMVGIMNRLIMVGEKNGKKYFLSRVYVTPSSFK